MRIEGKWARPFRTVRHSPASRTDEYSPVPANLNGVNIGLLGIHLFDHLVIEPTVYTWHAEIHFTNSPERT